MSKKIQVLDQHEHILKRPGMYIGSVEKSEENVLVYNHQQKKIASKKIEISRGLMHIVNEILQNARDHVINDPPCNQIKIWKQGEMVIIENNGSGISLKKDEDQNKYIPEIIFGVLLSSSNYNLENQTEEQNIVGG